MGYHKPVDPRDIWEYATRKLTDVSNVWEYATRKLTDVSNVWEYATRKLTEEILFTSVDVNDSGYILPEGLLYIIVYNPFGHTNDYYLEVNDGTSWIAIDDTDLSAYELRSYHLLSDNEHLRVRGPSGENIKVMVFKLDM